MTKNALIFTVGGVVEPTINQINESKPDFVYFIHSNESKKIADEIIQKTEIFNYEFKLLDDFQSIDNCFIASLDCIIELQNHGYEVTGDFTTGTKPMSAGLAFACFETGCNSIYRGSDEFRKDLGIVSGKGKSKNQGENLEIIAIREVKKAKSFFNQYQFQAALDNLNSAKAKFKDNTKFKERTELLIRIVKLYSNWDKFNDVVDNWKLNDFLDKKIIEVIFNDEEFYYYFNKIPYFSDLIKLNKGFLDKKLTTSDEVLFYYLADLLNNAYRRIEEGKFDDAVARLYRSAELISQIRFYQMGFVNKDKFFEDKQFSLLKDPIKKFATIYQLEEIGKKKLMGYNSNKSEFTLDLTNNYRLLEILSTGDFAKSNELLVKNFFKMHLNEKLKKRNTSILAHGLNPIKQSKANKLYKSVLKQSKIICEDIEEYMELAKFPKFDEGF